MKVSYIFILLSFVFVQCAQERDDSKNKKTKDNGAANEVKAVEKAETVDKIATHKFISTQTGVQEYLEVRQNDEGVKEWFYSSEKNLKEVKMGVTKKDGLHAIYFLNTPQELYILDLEDCGFMLTDSEDVEQWYRQTEPRCGV